MKEMEVLKEKLELTKQIDLILVTRHLCKRFRVDGSKAMSRGILGGKQVTKFANTSLFIPSKRDDDLIVMKKGKFRISTRF